MNLSPEVIDILTHRLTITGNHATMPPLDRPSYEAVNKALVMMGGKWNRSAKAHVFPSDPTAIIAAALDTGKVRDEKKEFQFFPTPAALARRMAILFDIQPDDLILEPSAGQGALITACIEQGANETQIRYCELDPKNRITLVCKGYKNFLTDNFLDLTTAIRFDKIIANPPFSNNQDIDHVRHMFRLLKPGGRMVVLTSPAWTFGSRRKQIDFREWIESEGFLQEEIPEGTFEDTNIRTILLVITKERVHFKSPTDFTIVRTNEKDTDCEVVPEEASPTTEDFNTEPVVIEGTYAPVEYEDGLRRTKREHTAEAADPELNSTFSKHAKTSVIQDLLF